VVAAEARGEPAKIRQEAPPLTSGALRADFELQQSGIRAPSNVRKGSINSVYGVGVDLSSSGFRAPLFGDKVAKWL
jgi:hypothetical protein